MSGDWPPAVVTALGDLALAHETVPTEQVVAGTPTVATAVAATIGGAEVGVWEITPGVVTDTEADEVFVVLSGRATVRFLEPELPEIEVAAGDLVRLTAGMRTQWTIHDTVRKVFVVDPR